MQWHPVYSWNQRDIYAHLPEFKFDLVKQNKLAPKINMQGNY